MPLLTLLQCLRGCGWTPSTEVERAGATTENCRSLEAVASVVPHAVPHDSRRMVAGVDPVTMLATGAEPGADARMCDTFWHLESASRTRRSSLSLAHGEGAAALRLSLNDRVSRSTLSDTQGYHEQPRAAFRTDGNTWAVADLYREGTHAFDEDDVAVMKGISSPPVRAHHPRARCTELTPSLAPASAPGLIVIDRDSVAWASANAEAVSHCDALGRVMSAGSRVASLRVRSATRYTSAAEASRPAGTWCCMRGR